MLRSGAADGGAGTLLKSTDGGSTWSPQTSGTPNALSGVACVSDSTCFADGAVGTTLVTRNGGAIWRQQGNPMSGPTTALNATNIALNGAACTAARCMVGIGVQGDIMTSAMIVDHTPPVTTATLTPGIRNGWYASPTLTLTATDGPSGSGVAADRLLARRRRRPRSTRARSPASRPGTTSSSTTRWTWRATSRRRS